MKLSEKIDRRLSGNSDVEETDGLLYETIILNNRL